MGVNEGKSTDPDSVEECKDTWFGNNNTKGTWKDTTNTFTVDMKKETLIVRCIFRVSKIFT